MGWIVPAYQLTVLLTRDVYVLRFPFPNFSNNFSLLQENKELRLALEEHQNVMELIMSKYRQQVAKLVTVNAKQTQPTSQDQAMVRAVFIIIGSKLFHMFSEVILQINNIYIYIYTPGWEIFDVVFAAVIYSDYHVCYSWQHR